MLITDQIRNSVDRLEKVVNLLVEKFNENHDEQGRFAEGGSGGGSSESGSNNSSAEGGEAKPPTKPFHIPQTQKNDALALGYIQTYNESSASTQKKMEKQKNHKVLFEYADHYGLMEGGAKAYKSWVDGLDDDAKNAIKDYVDGKYTDIRNCQATKRCTPAIKEAINAMDKVFKKAPKHGGLVHRGMSFESIGAMNKFIASIQTKKGLKVEAYTSTSTSASVSERFTTGGHSVFMNIHIKSGRAVPFNSGEKEVLLMKNTKLKLKSVYMGKLPNTNQDTVFMDFEE
jgi:hypothetical protein